MKAYNSYMGRIALDPAVQEKIMNKAMRAYKYEPRSLAKKQTAGAVGSKESAGTRASSKTEKNARLMNLLAGAAVFVLAVFSVVAIYMASGNPAETPADPLNAGTEGLPATPDIPIHSDYILMVFYIFYDTPENMFDACDYVVEHILTGRFEGNVIDVLFSHTGIEVLRFWFEEDKLYIDLDKSEIDGSKADYFDMGSMGGTIRLHNLLVSFSSLQGVEHIEILVDGQAGVVGNHFNFAMTYTADDYRLFPMPDFTAIPPIELEIIHDYVQIFLQRIAQGDAEKLGEFIFIDGGVKDSYTEIAQRVIEYYMPYDTGRAEVQHVFYYEIEHERRYKVLVQDSNGEPFAVDLLYGDGLAGIDVRMIDEETFKPEPPNAQTASYDINEVPAPRISVYVHALARLYYISVPPELAIEVENALKTGTPLAGVAVSDLGHGYANSACLIEVGYYGSDGSTGAIIRNSDGELGLASGADVIEATGEIGKLLELAAEATGWNFNIGLADFNGITRIEVVFDGDIFATVDSRENLDAFEEFLRNSVVSIGAAKTQEQTIELRCTLSSGETVSIVADPDNSMLWLPPVGYYSYPGYGWPDDYPGETQILLDILGLERWPIDIFTESYPEGFFDRLAQRVGALPPPEE